MSHNDVPMRKGMLHRPRIDELIREGLQYPLLIMLAGPGFGKTQAMASYLSASSDDIVWLRLRNIDNHPGHFWNHLVVALSDGNEELSGRLAKLFLPDNYSCFEAFADILAEYVDQTRKTIWVFDDFGVITDAKIINFFRTLADSGIKNFHLVLMTNALASPDSIAFMSNHQFLILGEQLRFTTAEIRQLYSLHQIRLEEKERGEIEHYTAGWPLPLHLLVLHRSKITDFISRSGRLSYQIISNLFEEHFFANYSETYKRLIVKLSFLSFFTKQFALDLYEGEKFDLEIFDNHAFLIFEPVTERFSFHQLYYIFLRQKQYLINREEARRLYQLAGDYYVAGGDSIEAIVCYRKCEDYIGMLRAIREYIRLEHDVTMENAPFFLEHLDLLPDEVVRANPFAEHLRALIYLNLLELDKAESQLQLLAQRLLTAATPDATELLGDVYAAIGSIHLLRNQPDFGEYYRKAVSCRPEGSRFHNPDRLALRNSNCFSLPDNQPGARARMERAMHDGMPWMSRFIHGTMSGREHLFSAEAAYLTQEFSEARQHAYRAIYKAQTRAQHDLVCNGYLLLARVAYFQGDFGELSRQIHNITEFAETCHIGEIKEIRDTALGWYYVNLHDYSRIPQNIFHMNDESRPMWSYGRSQLVYARYLIHNGEYARLVGMLEHPRGLLMLHAITMDHICQYIMLAIGYYHLDNCSAAIKALHKAYDMSYHNRLTASFCEFEDHMLRLIELVRSETDGLFDEQWLERIYKDTKAFSKHAEAVRAEYYQGQSDAAAPDNPLSKRERQVLQALSQGLTREEIAHRQYISVNTVKSTIRIIYNKLNASNRAEAVSIAITNKFIESHTPEQR